MNYPFEVRGKNFIIGTRPWLMGVLNITPDSFYDGGRFYAQEKAIARAFELAEQGIDILDIGGESSRPGSDPIPAEEELRRVIPVIKAIRPNLKCLLSIDTTKAIVAKAALDEGVEIINDISGLRADPEMSQLVAQSQAGVILMHMKGTPKTMQLNPYYDDVVAEIISFFQERLAAILEAGIRLEQIILDPGIGFGKRLEDNLRLINSLDSFLFLNRPILVGVSRKSFIGQILDLPPEDRLEGTIASIIISFLKGASIFRVHDPLAINRALKVAQAILASEPSWPQKKKTIESMV
ncbi:MAG: dihydropteroate synthase [Candidatus Aminicenantes bacterium]|nr:dihydropteroate synthase [Candidatus Aminicenantes bacterium]